MTDIELNQAIADAQQSCRAAWHAWELVRDAGETDLWCPEFQAHNAVQAKLSPLLVEQYNRDFNRKLALFAPPPMSDADGERAWREGPGSDAL